MDYKSISTVKNLAGVRAEQDCAREMRSVPLLLKQQSINFATWQAS
jgi:hypothetical protein